MRPSLFHAAALAILVIPLGSLAATISGKVTVNGPTPKRKVTDMSNPACG
jgi:hypothetical protein